MSHWPKEGKLPVLKTLGGQGRYSASEIHQLAEELPGLADGLTCPDPPVDCGVRHPLADAWLSSEGHGGVVPTAAWPIFMAPLELGPGVGWVARGDLQPARFGHKA